MVTERDLTSCKEAVGVRSIDTSRTTGDRRAGDGADSSGPSTAKCYSNGVQVGASRERVAKGSKRIPDQSNVGGVLRIDPSFHVGEGNYAAMGVLQWP